MCIRNSKKLIGEDIEWIFFDIGFTLVSEQKATEYRASVQANKEEAKAIGLTKKKILSEMIKVSNEYKDQFRAIMREKGIKDVVAHPVELEEVYPFTYDVLTKLKKKYKLGIIANQGEGLAKRLIERKLDSYFDVVCSSFDEKVHKPDLKLFEIALERANIEPSKCIMVGDRIDNDIYPANTLGMKTIWVRQGYARYQKPLTRMHKPSATINSLNNLPNLLGVK